MKLKEFLIKVDSQKALLLSYQLFKLLLKQVDLEDAASREEIAMKFHTVFIPYIVILETKEKPGVKLPKKITNLITYIKIKKLLSK